MCAGQRSADTSKLSSSELQLVTCACLARCVCLTTTSWVPLPDQRSNASGAGPFLHAVCLQRVMMMVCLQTTVTTSFGVEAVRDGECMQRLFYPADSLVLLSLSPFTCRH